MYNAVILQVGNKGFVSGQIPLVPGSMMPLPSGFEALCHLAIDHALTVAKAMGVSEEHIITAHCYVWNEADIEYVFSDQIKQRLPEKVRLFVPQSLCVIAFRELRTQRVDDLIVMFSDVFWFILDQGVLST